jgi:predicted metal-dependent hydrolase
MVAALDSMAERQGATPPPWLGRSRLRLWVDVVGGLRQNWDKLVQAVALCAAYFRPALVRRRLVRLRALGHIETIPTIAQLLVAGRDQMMVSATEETKIFYRNQHIPWVSHNLRRFLSGPATMLDPIGLFAPRDAIVEHVLQTFHRHPVYDLVLLRAHDHGVEEMARQARQIVEGTHRHQRALTSLVEDGAYHARLPADIDAFAADPRVPARPIPADLVDDPALMLAMDQFKDVGGFARYAARLQVGIVRAILAWAVVGFDETLGALLGIRLGPRRVNRQACDPEIVARHPERPA